MGLVVSSVLISPSASYIQASVTRRILSAIFDDLRDYKSDFVQFYRESKLSWPGRYVVVALALTDGCYVEWTLMHAVWLKHS